MAATRRSMTSTTIPVPRSGKPVCSKCLGSSQAALRVAAESFALDRALAGGPFLGASLPPYRQPRSVLGSGSAGPEAAWSGTRIGNLVGSGTSVLLEASNSTNVMIGNIAHDPGNTQGATVTIAADRSDVQVTERLLSHAREAVVARNGSNVFVEHLDHDPTA